MATGKSLAMLPWFVRDYIAATRQMSLAERGAYTDLLFFQWEMGPLPRDLGRLARLVGCGPDEFTQVWPTISEKFSESPAGLINPRLEEHRQKSEELSVKRATIGRAGGKASGESRRSKSEANPKQLLPPGEPIGEAIGKANGQAKSNSPSPSPSPSPDSGVLEDSDSRPRRARTRERPAYERQEFHDQVIAAYHELLPDLRRVKTWRGRRPKALNARIRERLEDGKPADTVAYWRTLFEAVAASDFLCGRIAPQDGREPFRADLEWLIRPENFAKVIEGRYDGRRANGEAHAR
jgi:uncharacterized protein YdaU (DUF1376 family)